MYECLKEHPNNRPLINYVLEHPALMHSTNQDLYRDIRYSTFKEI